jgi:hypothetical protein
MHRTDLDLQKNQLKLGNTTFTITFFSTPDLRLIIKPQLESHWMSSVAALCTQHLNRLPSQQVCARVNLLVWLILSN